MNTKDIDDKVMLCLKQDDEKRKGILLFLRKYKDVTDNQLRRSLDRLIRQKLVGRKRYSVYGLTEKGIRWGKDLNIEVTSSRERERLTKILNNLPLHLRAFVTLYLCGIIARHHLRRYFEEGFPSFLTYGKKGAGKSRSARLVFKFLGLDPEKHRRYVPNATPGELGLRRTREKGKQGYVITSSLYFQQPAVCFEEIDKATKTIRDALLVYFQGRRSYFVEEKEIEHKVCAMMTSNQTPEEMKIPDGITRRTPMLNTDAIQEDLEDVDLVFRKIFAGSIPHIELDKLQPKLNKLTECQYRLLRNLLKRCVTEDAWQYKVDTESTVILSLAMQALLDTNSIEQAILVTLYYRLLLLETTRCTVENWKNTLLKTWEKVGKPEQIIKLETKKETVQISPVVTPENKVEKEAKKVQAKVRIATEFRPQYKELMASVEKRINEIQSIQGDEIWQFLLPEEKEKFTIALDGFKVLKEHLGKTKEGDWVNLKALESAVSDVEKRYYSPLREIYWKGLERCMIEGLKEIKDYPLTTGGKWDANKWNVLERLDHSIANSPMFTEEQKRRIRENLPKAYKKRILSIKEHAVSEGKQKNQLGEKLLNVETLKTVISHFKGISPKKEKSKSEVSAGPKQESNTIVYHEKYYKGHPVKIIDQSEHRYTIRDATGKDMSVPKSEVKIIKKIRRVD